MSNQIIADRDREIERLEQRIAELESIQTAAAEFRDSNDDAEWGEGTVIFRIAKENDELRSSIAPLESHLAAAEKERDAWRAATGLASLTPEQAGERIDAMDDRLAAAEGVVEWYGEQARLCRLIHQEGDAGRHALSADGGERAKAFLARVAAWREGKQPVARGDMARAVELLRRAAYVNGTSIPRFVKFDGRHWGDDARDFLASIGGKA